MKLRRAGRREKEFLFRFARNDENGNARSPHPLPASEARERNAPRNGFFARAA